MICCGGSPLMLFLVLLFLILITVSCRGDSQGRSFIILRSPLCSYFIVVFYLMGFVSIRCRGDSQGSFVIDTIVLPSLNRNLVFLSFVIFFFQMSGRFTGE